jgi:hypothetical protein
MEEYMEAETKFQSISRVSALIVLGLSGDLHKNLRIRNRRTNKKNNIYRHIFLLLPKIVNKLKPL